jgi:hypothetical protein
VLQALTSVQHEHFPLDMPRQPFPADGRRPSAPTHSSPYYQHQPDRNGSGGGGGGSDGGRSGALFRHRTDERALEGEPTGDLASGYVHDALPLMALQGRPRSDYGAGDL